jgi:hypothetical protein
MEAIFPETPDQVSLRVKVQNITNFSPDSKECLDELLQILLLSRPTYFRNLADNAKDRVVMLSFGDYDDQKIRISPIIKKISKLKVPSDKDLDIMNFVPSKNPALDFLPRLFPNSADLPAKLKGYGKYVLILLIFIGKSARLTLLNLYPTFHENTSQMNETSANYFLLYANKNSCSYCDKISENEALKKCGKCMTAKYCSKECQKRDWEEHKTLCYDFVSLRYMLDAKSKS